MLRHQEQVLERHAESTQSKGPDDRATSEQVWSGTKDRRSRRSHAVLRHEEQVLERHEESTQLKEEDDVVTPATGFGAARRIDAVADDAATFGAGLERHEESIQSKKPDCVATSGTGLKRHEESMQSKEPDCVAT